MPPYFEYPKYPTPPGSPMPTVRDLTAEENRAQLMDARLRELERENRSVYEALHRYRERAEGADARVRELEKALIDAAVQMCADGVHIGNLKALCARAAPWVAHDCMSSEEVAVSMELQAAGRGEAAEGGK